jgi:hypothetical protein
MRHALREIGIGNVKESQFFAFQSHLFDRGHRHPSECAPAGDPRTTDSRQRCYARDGVDVSTNSRCFGQTLSATALISASLIPRQSHRRCPSAVACCARHSAVARVRTCNGDRREAARSGPCLRVAARSDVSRGAIAIACPLRLAPTRASYAVPRSDRASGPAAVLPIVRAGEGVACSARAQCFASSAMRPSAMVRRHIA